MDAEIEDRHRPSAPEARREDGLHVPAALNEPVSPTSDLRESELIGHRVPNSSEMEASGTALEDEDDDEQDQYMNLDEFAGPLREWIVLQGPQREIKRRFRSRSSRHHHLQYHLHHHHHFSTRCVD